MTSVTKKDEGCSPRLSDPPEWKFSSDRFIIQECER